MRSVAVPFVANRPARARSSRLWRTVKYEEVFLKDYGHLFAARESLGEYFGFYNEERRHSALAGQTPSVVYWDGRDRTRRAG